MKVLPENLPTGVETGSMEHLFTPSSLARELLFYPTVAGHFYCSAGFDFNRKGDFFYLVCLVEGKVRVSYRGENYVAIEGDVILIDGRLPRTCIQDQNTEFYCIGFNGSNTAELVEYIFERKGSLLRSKNAYMIRQGIEKAVDYYEKYDVDDPFSASSRIYSMLLTLMEEENMDGEYSSEVITQSIYYIRENLNKRITMESLAKMVGLSPAYYSWLFKQRTGFSPREYIMDARLGKAKTLLAKTDKTVSEIAENVGYSNVVSLTNLFRKHVGCSPLAYRREVREKKSEGKNA